MPNATNNLIPEKHYEKKTIKKIGQFTFKLSVYKKEK